MKFRYLAFDDLFSRGSVSRALVWSGALALTLAAGVAHAQDDDPTALGSPSDAPIAEEDEAPPRLGDDQADAEDGTAWGDDSPSAETVRESTDPFEEANTDYFFLGGFYRHVIIPGFIQELFVEGGIDGSNPGAGISFNYRRNNFNIVANAWWNNASGQGYFRANGDPRTDTEFIDVQLGVVFFTAEFLWSFPITDWLAFELGFDLGFGFIYGNLTRTEAYESSAGAGDYQPCDGPGGGTPGYCEPAAPPPCYANSGGHYDCNEPNWFTDGGDTPFLFPWVSLPHIAVRIKPIKQIQIRLDGGYGLYSFFFGGSLSYGF
ncbi:MAG TPA: hypothetical protein DEF51_11345 [Myxococcales bacterium]|nr:hypothetical protein [Myxococcales bacterium]